MKSILKKLRMTIMAALTVFIATPISAFAGEYTTKMVSTGDKALPTWAYFCIMAVALVVVAIIVIISKKKSK